MQQRYCGNCGNELPEGVRFYRNCGSPVHATAREATLEAEVEVPLPPEQAPSTASPEPRRRGVERTILGSLLLVTGLICVLCFGLILSVPMSGKGSLLGFFGLLAAVTLYGAWRNLRNPS